MREEASILHLDLDAFFASVEQRDKPSLRGKPVIVGGIGGRGVVSTASYEARVFGVHSAMRMVDARAKAPMAAVLSGRFQAYRQSSRIVMRLLRELSPLIEPLSLDEAYVDLAAGGIDCSDIGAVEKLVTELRAELHKRTAGLTASVGVATAKSIAKIASETAKPDGQLIVVPGTEVELITPLAVRALPGIGPATMERLALLGIRNVADLQTASRTELVHEFGIRAADWLKRIAFARDDRVVEPYREAKSISMEDTFATDITDRAELERIIASDSVVVARQLAKHKVFARTVTIKVRLPDFTTYTRSRTLSGATDRAERIAHVAQDLLRGLDTPQGVRLLGVGTANFTQAAQEELFDEDAGRITEEVRLAAPASRSARHIHASWHPGDDIIHDTLGRGWVWGSGDTVVTVRFENRDTGIGPVRSFEIDDPALHHADPLPLEWDTPEPEESNLDHYTDLVVSVE
ncbi:MAG: DNA polymerase IV [Propionibacteriaceae bacterium]|jgi:DNA polymerase-4|nr:DNA polymerase IV [Propionibacteriaceae bacterium]